MYLYLYSLLVCAAIGVVVVSQPHFAVIQLIGVFLLGGLGLLNMGFEILGIFVIMIYAGAIAVLFLFIILLVQLKRFVYDRTTHALIGLLLMVVCVLQACVYLIFIGCWYIPTACVFDTQYYTFLQISTLDTFFVGCSNIQLIGLLLLEEYPLVTWMCAIVLLQVTIGCLYLINIRRGYAARREYLQNMRHQAVQLVLCNRL